jgi:hypothetical protein
MLDAENTMRVTFVAKLVGSDGLIVSRAFEDEPAAIAWLQGEGLAHFNSGQAARSEVHSQGRRVWAQST